MICHFSDCTEKRKRGSLFCPEHAQAVRTKSGLLEYFNPNKKRAPKKTKHMDMHEVIKATLDDEADLVRALNAAALALNDPPTLYRLVVSTEHNGAPGNPRAYYRDLLVKVNALLAIAEKSDKISFIATETHEKNWTEEDEKQLPSGKVREHNWLKYRLGLIKEMPAAG